MRNDRVASRKGRSKCPRLLKPLRCAARNQWVIFAHNAEGVWGVERLRGSLGESYPSTRRVYTAGRARVRNRCERERERVAAPISPARITEKSSLTHEMGWRARRIGCIMERIPSSRIFYRRYFFRRAHRCVCARLYFPFGSFACIIICALFAAPVRRNTRVLNAEQFKHRVCRQIRERPCFCGAKNWCEQRWKNIR